MSNIIWIVEDDPSVSEIIKIILNDQGYKVEIFENNNSFQNSLNNYKPDLIILDINLGTDNGTVICHNIKRNRNLKNIPVIMISADGYVDLKSKNCGAEAYLKKPFSINDLINVVNNNMHLLVINT